MKPVLEVHCFTEGFLLNYLCLKSHHFVPNESNCNSSWSGFFFETQFEISHFIILSGKKIIKNGCLGLPPLVKKATFCISCRIGIEDFLRRYIWRLNSSLSLAVTPIKNKKCQTRDTKSSCIWFGYHMYGSRVLRTVNKCFIKKTSVETLESQWNLKNLNSANGIAKESYSSFF